MLKYFLKIGTYLGILFVSVSIFAVLVFRFVPVTVTPLKVIRFFENFGDCGFEYDSKWVSIDRINPSMIQAVIATEDNNFVYHSGFDFEAIRKAIHSNKRGKRLRGASTISQQTAKNVFCPPNRTWFRKGVETYFTFLIELVWSKERIMEVYLNVIETGKNVYGVGAASERFYKKPAAKLNAYESAMIAAVLPNPRVRNLSKPSSYMARRAGQIRYLMQKVGPVDLQHPAPEPPKKKRR